MDDWVENGYIGPILDEKGEPLKITTLAFDTHQELVWLGFESGRVTSFLAREWTRYTSYVTNREVREPIRQLLFNEKGIFSLTPKTLQFRLRRAVPQWSLSSSMPSQLPAFVGKENMTSMDCMTFLPKSTSKLLVAGADRRMLVLDVSDSQDGRLVENYPRPSEEPIIMLKSTTLHIVAATRSGWVYVLDPVTYAARYQWKPHQSKISDMCVNSDHITTCGFAQRDNSKFLLEHFLHVFSLSDFTPRMVPFAAGPLHVCSHSVDNSTVFVLSPHGQIHMIHLNQSRSTVVKQTDVVNSPGPGMMEVAPTMQAAAIICEDGLRVVIWSYPNDQLRTCNSPQQPELPNNTPWNRPKIQWTPETPLNVIGMPYYTETLLSAWPEMWHTFGRPPARFDRDFTHSLKPSSGNSYLYGVNPRKGKYIRNQVEPSQIITKLPPKDESRYLSQARHDAQHQDKEDPWRFLSIKFSRFGFSDFDFRFFNDTGFSGLTNHLNNSYANPLLQLLRFTPVVRNAALHHLSGSCINDSCLLCELGFLFDMMEKAKGSICQATNLLRTLAHDPQAQAYFPNQGTAEKGGPGDTLQVLARFLTERIVAEYRDTAEVPDRLQKALSVYTNNKQWCESCSFKKAKNATSSVTDLMYPNDIRPSLTFSKILKDSVERDLVTKGWCDKCKKYRQIHSKKTVLALPDVFVLNATVNTPERKTLWMTPGWLPAEIAIIVNGSQLYCYQGADIQVHLDRGVHPVEVYSLVGMASSIDKDSLNEKSHLVATANTSYCQENPNPDNPWFVMNDFLVRQMKSSAEALSFDERRTPYVLIYQANKHNHIIDNSWKSTIDSSLLFADDDKNPEKPYQVLDPKAEAPRLGTVVALDSEFVSVGDEGIAITSVNDDAKVERPSPKTVARLSVLRGDQGPRWGVPFIDDYIRPKEQVRDYLTEYSGIYPQDLDPKMSKRHLVSLKVAIKKLWILLNLGCRFVGHGLSNDFRELNLIVPKSQRIDTVELFQSRVTKRRLGLSFLLWSVFSERIQKTTHDSIEDARAALMLYEKFLQMQANGTLDREIENIFARGQAYNFRVPKEAVPYGARATTPPSAAGPGGLPLPQPPSTPVKNNAGYLETRPGAGPSGTLSPYSSMGTPWSAKHGGGGGSPMP
ncbi:PAB-dependent poly(A)-specific ribonuclease subunit PAN2 [Zalerion maritima]|uniref:PAB-dependent poly(A)-specific ribonuclease subunit PAN2 n=1 Tax=Zalerion maritima TaxID=339359 RepID=A0AAD5WRP7_9PEZI|nr:PAB-dependent poly(A)-specific ribonuclease subunit PAN2 [Zalerion maritima]